MKKILISNRAGIGDVLLTTPVLKAVKEKYPQSKVIFLTGPNCYELVQGLDFIDEIVTYDKKESSMLSVIRKIWGADIQLCIDFKYRTPVMGFLAGIPIRVGLKHKRKLFMTNFIENDVVREDQYESKNYADIINLTTKLDIQGEWHKLISPKVQIQDRNIVSKLLDPLDGQDFITISPYTSWKPKNWPIENYKQLIKILIKEKTYKIVLIGTAAEREKLPPDFAHLDVLNLMGRTNLMQTVDIIDRSIFLIGGCSAPLHMAASVNTPVVALYGPTSYKRWAPQGENNVILCKNINCSPCNRDMIGCTEQPCMKKITVQEVENACNKLICKIKNA